MIVIDRETAEALALGGGVLGAGGGGNWREGLRYLQLAMEIGRPHLVSLDALPPEATVVTVSGVGSPAATERDVRVSDYLEALELLIERAGIQPGGLISSENGGASSANGFVQSALTGIPVVDAPANGRAHPTGVMGSMGLHRLPGYLARQTAVGGTPERRVCLYVEGSLASVDQVVRQAAVSAGGLVAVARNPVTADYVRENGAPGALTLAIELGRLILSHKDQGGMRVAETLLEYFGAGECLGPAIVQEAALETRGGYDIGQIRIGEAETRFWNEFMTVEISGVRKASFPDLIFALGAEDGLPYNTAELRPGNEVVLVWISKERLPLGTGVRGPDALKSVETALGVSLAPQEA